MARALRLLAITDRPLPLEGGGQISVVTLLGQLARFGHTGEVVGLGVEPATMRRHGVRIRSFADWQQLAAALRRFRPDVLISTHETSIAAAQFAERYSVPHIVWAQSFELCPPTPAEARAWHVRADRVYLSATARAFVLRQATLLAVNSAFMQARFRRLAGRASQIIHPPIETSDYLVDVVRRTGPVEDGAGKTDAGAIVGVCGYGYKGADVFLQLAERMPHRPFLLAGRIIEPWRARAAALPNVTLLPFGPARAYLSRSRVLLVPSQWPEPFGRVALEAMAAGVPVIASRTGGLPECCGDAALLVSRFRSVDAWHSALERLLAAPSLAATLVRRGRARASRVAATAAMRGTERIIRRVASAQHPRWDAPPLVLLSGNTDARSAFALINRQWALAAPARSQTVVATSPETADRTIADLQIRSDLTQRFEAWTPPLTGHLAAVRTWDFGPYPKAWVEALVAHYDQLWVWTRWIRRQAIASGVPANRVRVVPPGVDTEVFTPAGPRHRWPDARFTFLFVGAPVARKGIDTLLAAYLQAFTRHDRVRLVIKAHPDDVFYRAIDARPALQTAMARAEAPEIVFVDRFLPPARLAALYRSADACVFPYRAEGFCLPIVEAMACGRPTLVPKFGAALDFCSPRTSFMLPVKRISVPVGRSFAINTLGFEQQIDAVDFCEVGVEALAEAMRAACAADASRLARIGAAARTVAERYSWEASRRAVDAAIADMLAGGVPVRFRQSRAAAREHRGVLAAARALYLGRSSPAR